MLITISKIIFKSGKSYLLFIFIATFLSLFSYLLSSNIVLSVDTYLKDQTKVLLGGDIVLTGGASFNKEYFENTYGENLQVAKTIETQTTLFDENEKGILVELVYRDPNYPLYDSFSYDIINQSGALIVDASLYEKLGESIEIFGKIYLVEGIITASPLGNFSSFNIQSTVYIPLEAYDTSINSSNSRINTKHYVGFKGEYDSEIIKNIKNDERFSAFTMQSLEDRNENIGEITDRLSLFINFFNLVVFVLTFFIIILSLETFYKKLKHTLGLLNILGLSKNKIFLYNFIFIAFLFSISLVFAVLANYVAFLVLGNLYDFLNFYSSSLGQGVLISGVLLIIGVYSPFYKIYTSRTRDLLSDTSFFSHFSFINYFVYLSLIFIAFYCISVISYIPLYESFLYSIGCIVGLIFLYILTSFLLKIVYVIFGKSLKNKNYYIYDALRSTIKPGNVSFFIVFSSFISFLSLFVFYVFSGSFISFIDTFTANSNDTFIVDVASEDILTTKEYFSEDEIYTIVPLRILKINNISLSEYVGQEKPGMNFSREFLSTTRNLDTDILTGTQISAGGVSVDSDFAADLGVNLGDLILFNSAGLEIELRVLNIRQAIRSGGNPFFYFSLLESDFDKYPKKYFVSYKSSEKSENIQFEYSKAIQGTAAFINAKEIIDIVLDITNKVLLIIYFCLTYIIIFAFLSLLVSVRFLRNFKTTKFKLMYILGGNKKSLMNAIMGEYMYLLIFGLSISLISGSIILSLLAYYITYFALDMSSYIEGIGLVGGILILMSTYLIITKKTKN